MANESLRCIVLSSGMVPVSIVKSLHALVLFLKDKVYIVEEHPEVRYHSPSRDFPAPSLVCLKKHAHLPDHYYTEASLNLRSLKIRDRGTCQYCHRTHTDLAPKEYWTRDHVLPRCRGGENTWSNVVLCCSSCNARKGDKTPEEWGYKLPFTPTTPTKRHLELLRRNRHEKQRGPTIFTKSFNRLRQSG